MSIKSYDRFIDSQDKTVSFKIILKWYKHRVLNFIPIYYLFVILYGMLYGGSSFWLGSDEKILLWNYLSHFTFLNAFIPKHINSIIGVEWYIVVYLLLIIITPFIHKVCKNIWGGNCFDFILFSLCVME